MTGSLQVDGSILPASRKDRLASTCLFRAHISDITWVQNKQHQNAKFTSDSQKAQWSQGHEEGGHYIVYRCICLFGGGDSEDQIQVSCIQGICFPTEPESQFRII